LSEQHLLYTLDEGVAILTLNRPDRLNALSTDLLGDLGKALDRAVAEGARCILLKGEGRAFSSGADLVSTGGLPDDLGKLLEDHYNPLVRKFAAIPVPVVSAVQGAAAGAGCSFALAADLVVAARSAYFLLAFANIGLVPDAGATWMLAKAVGRARAMEMALLGEKIPAEKAAEWGLIHKAVDDDALQETALTLAKRLAAGPVLALGAIRRAVNGALDHTFDEVLDQERDDQRAAGRTEDAREAIAAFGEKRKPVFRGK
jgi:2-(1,2-epoxy-1,2-dihydrophenyl)acetyl-CoA isomerase